MNQGVNKSICTVIACAITALSLGACQPKEDKTAEDVKAIRSMMESDKAELARREQESIDKNNERIKQKRESR